MIDIKNFKPRHTPNSGEVGMTHSKKKYDIGTITTEIDPELLLELSKQANYDANIPEKASEEVVTNPSRGTLESIANYSKEKGITPYIVLTFESKNNKPQNPEELLKENIPYQIRMVEARKSFDEKRVYNQAKEDAKGKYRFTF